MAEISWDSLNLQDHPRSHGSHGSHVPGWQVAHPSAKSWWRRTFTVGLVNSFLATCRERSWERNQNFRELTTTSTTSKIRGFRWLLVVFRKSTPNAGWFSLWEYLSITGTTSQWTESNHPNLVVTWVSVVRWSKLNVCIFLGAHTHMHTYSCMILHNCFRRIGGLIGLESHFCCWNFPTFRTTEANPIHGVPRHLRHSYSEAGRTGRCAVCSRSPLVEGQQNLTTWRIQKYA